MKKLILSLTLAATCISTVSAADFFSTEKSSQLFNLGVRVGLNTSNRTLSSSSANLWNKNSWGIGFDAGVVADINFKDFISLQPGFFYETRSGSFAYQSIYYTEDGDHDVFTQLGKGREYLFTIPVLASVHFNITDDLRWDVECGPYLQIKLKSTFDRSFEYPWATAGGGLVYLDNVKTAKVDVGLKIGTGLNILDDYYIGVHYLAGFCHPWFPGELGGRNKEWMFTIGYNFF